MHTVEIYGSSDDLIEIEGTARGCDEYNHESATFLFRGKDGEVRIHAEYGNNGCWNFQIIPTDEGVELLPMKIDGLHQNGYSPSIVIENVEAVERLAD